MALGDTFVLTLEPSRDSVPAARRAVVGWAMEVDAKCVVEVVALLVSEVAANVVQHAGTTYTLRAYWLPPIFRVEVSDGAAVPKRVPRRAGQVGGWGFELLDKLSRAWGIDERGPSEKAVWFEVEQPAA